MKTETVEPFDCGLDANPAFVGELEAVYRGLGLNPDQAYEAAAADVESLCVAGE